MWDAPKSRFIEGTARPLRVAYLIDSDDCSHLLIDEIISECFSRWAGRRSPIIPAKPGSIAPVYLKWLRALDPDIIYSYVDLDKELIEFLHEELTPGFLVRHDSGFRDADDDQRFRVQLPIEGLSSLSVLPVYATRRWGLLERPKDITVLDKFRDKSNDAFVMENFGFISESYSNTQVASAAPELFQCLTLITQDSLDNHHLGKSDAAVYEVCSRELLRALAARRTVLPLSTLSEMFSHCLTSAPMGQFRPI